MIKIEKKIHKGWRPKEEMERMGLNEIFGKYQYIYSSKKGEISLILLKDYLEISKDSWEILSLKGDLFEDVERFGTQKEAAKRIKELLD